MNREMSIVPDLIKFYLTLFLMARKHIASILIMNRDNALIFITLPSFGISLKLHIESYYVLENVRNDIVIYKAVSRTSFEYNEIDGVSSIFIVLIVLGSV